MNSERDRISILQGSVRIFSMFSALSSLGPSLDRRIDLSHWTKRGFRDLTMIGFVRDGQRIVVHKRISSCDVFFPHYFTTGEAVQVCPGKLLCVSSVWQEMLACTFLHWRI